MRSNLIKNRLLWLTLGVAIFLTIITVIELRYGWYFPNVSRFLMSFLVYILFFPWIVGVWLCRNGEAPDSIWFLIPLFITYIIILGFIIAMILFVHKNIIKKYLIRK